MTGAAPCQRANTRRSTRRVAVACAFAAVLATPAVGQTPDLAGANVTLPKAPFFISAWLSGANNATNSSATGAVLTEDG